MSPSLIVVGFGDCAQLGLKCAKDVFDENFHVTCVAPSAVASVAGTNAECAVVFSQLAVDGYSSLLKGMKPGGVVLTREPALRTANAGNKHGLRTSQDVAKVLLFAGYLESSIDGTACDEATVAAALGVDEKAAKEVIATFGTELYIAKIRSQKPDYAVGASSSIVLPKKATNSWAAELGQKESELADERDLLRPEDKRSNLAENCGPSVKAGKRQPCKNCSCGLAEKVKIEGDKPEPKAVKSACGNCGLGDAFRCAGCPYLGKPAFKPGEKVMLDMNDDIDSM